MGLAVSLIIIAVGAILTFAVNVDEGAVDPQVVGVVLMVVGFVAFLCGPDAAMVRGQTLIVDGGFSLLA